MPQQERVVDREDALKVDDDRDVLFKVPGRVEKVDGGGAVDVVRLQSLQAVCHKGVWGKLEKAGSGERGGGAVPGKEAAHPAVAGAVEPVPQPVGAGHLVVEGFAGRKVGLQEVDQFLQPSGQLSLPVVQHGLGQVKVEQEYGSSSLPFVREGGDVAL